MSIKKFTNISVLTAVLLVAVFSFVGAHSASAEYDGSNIIDNSVFLDANSMGASAIQSFLASKGSGLASSNFVMQCSSAGSTANQLYISAGAPCNQSTSAANIIYYASRIYGVNPQVILATIQKEQSLVTTANPTVWQLTQAMGYDCPTTGSCDTSSSFFYQIDNGTWVLRYHYERANGNNSWWSPSSSWVCGIEKNFYKPNLYPGQNVRFYDGNGVNYRTYYIQNAATSAFYCYTPHAYNNPQGLYGRPAFGTTGQYYSGSYNFVTSFEAWFGSTKGGELVRTASSGQVYIVNDNTGKKYPVNNMDIFNDYSPLGLRFVSDTYLSQYSVGHAVTNLAQSPNGTLSLITAGIKLPFSSCSGDVIDYGFTCSSDQFLPLTEAQSIKLANGPGVTRLVKSNTNATIYYVDNGSKRPIAGWEDLVNLKIPIAINVISQSSANHLKDGYLLYGPGALVRTANSSTVYVVKDMSTLMPITTYSYPDNLGLGGTTRIISDSIFQQVYGSASGATQLTNKVKCGGVDYIGTGKTLYRVNSTIASHYGYNLQDFRDVGQSLCSVLNLSTQTLSQYMRVDNGTIYYVAGGQKRAFSSYATFQSASYCNNSCDLSQVSTGFTGLISSGANL